MELQPFFQAIDTASRGLAALPGGHLASLLFAACSYVAMVKVYRCALRAQEG